MLFAFLKLNLGPDQYNNFIIFRGVAHHFFEQLPLYAPYPDQYFDTNHYGPFFAIIVAPFAYLPVWLAMPLWIGLMTSALFWAIKCLPIDPKWQCVAFLIMLNDMISAVCMQQFNIAIAAILIGSTSLILKRKEGWAALILVAGTLVKIYPIVGFAMFFFAKRKLRFLFFSVLWGVILILTPALFVDANYLWGQYEAWFLDIISKNSANLFAYLQNISLIGFIRKVSGNGNYSDIWIIGTAVLLYLGSLLRWKQFKYTKFQLYSLVWLLLFVVLFSSGSENSGYIIATAGVGIWWCLVKKRTVFYWILLGLVLVASFSLHLFPSEFYGGVFIQYSLRSIPFFLVWCDVTWKLLFLDFNRSQENVNSSDLTHSDIDLVLPCYNPDNEWVERAAEKFNDLRSINPNHYIRLIVSNDGSKYNFTDAYKDRLKELIPDVVIVDNKVNMGKGAALRSGIADSSAPLVLYTDYDFPYVNKSVSDVILKLEDGYDIVLAERNHTYHTKLSHARRFASWASKNMNWFILGMKYPDAQGGLKGFNERGKNIFLETKINTFLFDTEFIYMASNRPDIKISKITTNLRDGVDLPPISRKTLRRESLNFIKIVLKV